MSTGNERVKRKITKIAPQNRDPKRLSIFLNGRFALGIDSRVAQDLGLRQGLELSQAKLQEVRLAEEMSKAKGFALDFIGYRARSVWEVDQRLKKRGHSERIIDQVLGQLLDSGLLDDEQFAAQWARGRMATKPLGERLLRHELKIKGISDEIVDKTVAATFQGVSQSDLATDLLRARRTRYVSLDWVKARRRMRDFLLRRGFSRDVAWDAVAQVKDEENWD
jgi:regulatory protein